MEYKKIIVYNNCCPKKKESKKKEKKKKENNLIKHITIPRPNIYIASEMASKKKYPTN
jgi:hypothetical protein